MGGKLKSKHVLFCTEFTDLGLSYVKLILEQDIKTLVVVNGNAEKFQNLDISKNGKVMHISADVTKIADMEEVYKATLKSNKKIDVIINSKEISTNPNWEEDITTHINAMICSTLLAMKYLGKMNSGKGGTVVNSLTVFSDDKSSENTAYMGISSLLDDLDRSFGDPYYYSSTSVQILTMCANMEIRNGEKQNPEGATSTSTSNSWWDALGSTLLKVIEEKKSHVHMIASEAGAEPSSSQLEQFEINVEPET